MEEWLVHIGEEVHEETSVRGRVSRRDTMQRVDSIDQDHEDVSIVLHSFDELRPLVIDVYRSAKAVEFLSVAQLRAKPPDFEVAPDRVVVFLAQVEKPGEEGVHTVDMCGSHGAGARGGGVTGDLRVDQNVFVRERIDPTHADCKLLQLSLALEATWVEVDQALAEDLDELTEELWRRMIFDQLLPEIGDLFVFLHVRCRKIPSSVILRRVDLERVERWIFSDQLVADRIRKSIPYDEVREGVPVEISLLKCPQDRDRHARYLQRDKGQRNHYKTD